MQLEKIYNRGQDMTKASVLPESISALTRPKS